MTRSPLRIVLSVLTALCSTAAVAAGTPPASILIETSGSIEIDGDGHVRQWTPDGSSKLNANVADVLDRSLMTWRFDPVLMDGKPVIAKTAVYLSIKAELMPHGNYQLRLQDVDFGTPLSANPGKIPRYPMAAARANIGARVVVVLQLDADGRVKRSHVRQVSLDTPIADEKKAGKLRQSFAEAAVRSLDTWTFERRPEFASEPMPETVVSPIVFKMGRAPSRSTTLYLPGPVQPAPWQAPEQLIGATEALAEGAARSVDSRVRLQGNPVGQLLMP